MYLLLLYNYLIKTKLLTRNRYCKPYTMELTVKTGFQSSLSILRQTFPLRSIFG